MSDRSDTIENSVINVKLVTDRVDLDEVAASLGNDVEFEPEEFMAVKVKRERGSILLFASGKIVYAGRASIEEKRRDIQEFCERITECGIAGATVKSFEVVNIVSSVEVGKDIDLERLYRENSKSQYNPEEFPLLTLYLDEFAAQVAASGKAVLMGVRDVKRLAEFQDQLLVLLREYVIEGEEGTDG